MAKVAKTNPKFLTKEEMAQTLVVMYGLYKKGILPFASFRIQLDHTLWCWTEYNGKHKGCLWWSPSAYKYFMEHNDTKGLIHEHVVPRKIIREEIVSLLKKGVTKEELQNFLEHHLIGCVITKEEDEKLKEEKLKQNLGCPLTNETTWNRYDIAHIPRQKITW